MNTPKKTSVTTKDKSKPLSIGNSKHTANPTSSSGNTKAKMGQATLNGAQGSKGKYC